MFAFATTSTIAAASALRTASTRALVSHAPAHCGSSNNCTRALAATARPRSHHAAANAFLGSGHTARRHQLYDQHQYHVTTTHRRAAAAAPGRRSVATTTMAAHNHLKEGDTVPSVVFKTRVRVPALEAAGEQNPFDWKDVTSEDYFKGKRTVLFALPGAFTPTCSSTHLPGYERDYETIKSLGVDDVYCLSVNDAFVMYQWGLKQGATNVKLIPDGACLFTRGMGLTCTWTTERGFGERSWRYSMVVNDMKIEKIFVEPNFVENSGPDPFEVSDSTTMVNYLKSVKK